MKKLAVCLFALLFSLQAGYAQRSPSGAGAYSAQMLHQDMRKLWTDHVVWTRDYIVAAVGGYHGRDQRIAEQSVMKGRHL